MTLLHRLASILRWIVRRDRAEKDLHDEVQAFADMAAADRRRGGASATEAQRLAVLDLGGVERLAMVPGSMWSGEMCATDCVRSDTIRHSRASRSRRSHLASA